MVTSSRDVSLDVLRAACTIVVVALHATMAGILVSGGAVRIDNALETSWFWPFSWVVQIMPLFFLAGGATAASSLRRRDDVRGFAASRVQRLMAPLVPALGAIAVGLAALGALGLPPELVEEAGFRISQPLWFLGVFVLVQSLAPLLLRAHEQRPAVTIGALVALTLAVDVVRTATGIDAVGFLNLAFVWLLGQQLGFVLAGGGFARLTVRTRLIGAAVALAGIPALAATGLVSLDMYENLNPPTIALALLGFAQACLFSIAQPRLRAWGARRRAGAAVRVIGRHAMSIYLWHMPALVVVAAVTIAGSLALGIGMPVPLTGEWWASRPIWILAVGAATCCAVALVARTSAAQTPGAPSGGARAACSVALAVGAVALVFVLGLDVGSAVLAIAVALLALRIARAPRTAGGKPPVTHTRQQDFALLARQEG